MFVYVRTSFAAAYGVWNMWAGRSPKPRDSTAVPFQGKNSRERIKENTQKTFQGQQGFHSNFSQVRSTFSPIRTEQNTLDVLLRTPHLVAVRQANRTPKSRVKQPCNLTRKTYQVVVSARSAKDPGKCQKWPTALSIMCATSNDVAPVAA